MGENGSGSYFITSTSFNAYNVWNGNGRSLSGWFKASPTTNDFGGVISIFKDNNIRITMQKNNTSSYFYIKEVGGGGSISTYDQ